MDNKIFSVNILNFSNITEDNIHSKLKGATLTPLFDEHHPFRHRETILTHDDSTLALHNSTIELRLYVNTVVLWVNRTNVPEFFNFHGDSTPEVLRLFINGVKYHCHEDHHHDITLNENDIIEFTYLDPQEIKLHTNILVITKITRDKK